MTGKTFKNDMTMMFAYHDALRRELERIVRITAEPNDDPAHILRTAVGWEMFKTYLHVHHGAEDDVLWPAMRTALTERPDDLALLAAMEAEHARVDPGLAAIDAALADRDIGPEQLGGLVEGLRAGLGRHLKHEEDEALDLIDAVATAEQLDAFGQEHTKRIGADTPRFLPWLLDGANEHTVQNILGVLPPPALLTYQNQWRPAYPALGLWDPTR